MAQYNNLAAPQWKVTYDGSFWSSKGRGLKEITVGKTFAWGSEVWHVPAIYVCGKGLIIDFCVEVEPQLIKSYIDKWDLLNEERNHYTEAQQEQMRSENPLHIDFIPTALVNGRGINCSHSCAVTWIPESCLNGASIDMTEAKVALEHYGLDLTRGWIVRRSTFDWDTKRAPKISSLKLKLERMPTDISGISFTSPAPGDVISFTHPITGVEHKLTVQEYEAQDMDIKGFPDEAMEYPSHYTMMTYTLSPDISGRNIRVQDCERSDSPRVKAASPHIIGSSDHSATSIGIIGGSDGPTAIAFSIDAQKPLHAALSSPHFEPRDKIEWHITFSEKLVEDTSVTLI